MDKKEEKILKFNTIQALKKAILKYKEFIKADWNFRDMYGGDITVHQEIRELYRREFLLCAAEKQIPMPVKIKTSLEGEFSGWWEANGTYHVGIHYNAYCQNCGHKVERGVKGMGAGFEHNKDEQYCLYCGQKLWWPKN